MMKEGSSHPFLERTSCRRRGRERDGEVQSNQTMVGLIKEVLAQFSEAWEKKEE